MLYAHAQNFDNFEEFNAFPTGWDTRFQLNGALNCKASLAQSRGEGVLINTATLSSGTLQEGNTPSYMRTFALPLTLEGDMSWLGKDADQYSLLQFGDSCELFAVAAGGCSICTLSLDNAILENLLAQRGLDAATVFREEAVFPLSARDRTLLLRDLSLLSEFLVKYGQHDVMPTLSLGLQEELLGSLVDHLAASTIEQAPLPLHAAARQVRSAIRYMQEADGCKSIVEIGDALKIGRRSLELSFRKYVGLSPQRYLKMLRLQRCRQALIVAIPGDTSVGAVARQQGFWHMGQFSQDYQALFEERPSATLALRR